MMLTVEDLHAGYGASIVLQGLGLTIEAGEIVTILGRNGSGRSTLCKALMGLIPKRGRVVFQGIDLTASPAHEIAGAGIGYVPEERAVFQKLTVEENLLLGVKGSRSHRPAWQIDELFALFPRLRERRRVKAGNLSGGEQQMLSIFRTMLGNPELILVDEPTEGLAPMIVERVGETLRELKRRGTAVLLLEQKLALALEVADRVLVMGHGQIVFAGSVDSFRRSPDIRRRWLEVS
jgi:branched-chain amino acid transport system ATP-binding protein